MILQHANILYVLKIDGEPASSAVTTCWAVALTCYISHSAKHRKMADFDPSKPLNWCWCKLGITLLCHCCFAICVLRVADSAVCLAWCDAASSPDEPIHAMTVPNRHLFGQATLSKPFHIPCHHVAVFDHHISEIAQLVEINVSAVWFQR